MIKINLLGRKKGTQISQVFGDLSSKVGLSKINFSFPVKDFIEPVVKIAIVVVGLYVGYYVPNDMVAKEAEQLGVELTGYEREEQKLQAELNTKKEVRAQMERLDKQETELKRQLSIISRLSQDRNIAFEVLNNLTVMIPNMVWLESITFDKQTVVVKGSSWDYYAINTFLRTLSESVVFGAVTLRTIDAGTAAVSPPGSTISPEALPRIKIFEIEMLVKKKT